MATTIVITVSTRGRQGPPSGTLEEVIAAGSNSNGQVPTFSNPIILSDTTEPAAPATGASVYAEGGSLKAIGPSGDITVLTENTARDFPKEISRASYTGVISGFVLSVNPLDFTEFKVGAGVGIIVDLDDPENPVYTSVAFAETGFIAGALFNTPGVTTTHVLVNQAGSVIQKGTLPDIDDTRVSLAVGNVQHSSGLTAFDGLVAPTQTPFPGFGLDATFSDLLGALGGANVIGSEFTAVTGTLKLARSAGDDISLGRGYDIDSNRPNTPFTAAIAEIDNGVLTWVDGSGNLQFVESNLVDSAQYNNAGSLVATPTDKYQIVRVFHFPVSDTTAMYYGTTLYNSFNQAITNRFTEKFVESPITKPASYRTDIIVKGGATDLNDPAQAVFIQAGRLRPQWGAITALEAVHATLADTTFQKPIVTTPVPITFNTNVVVDGITHSTTVNPEAITIETTGHYSIHLKAQVERTSGGTTQGFRIWMRLNDVDIALSKSVERIASGANFATISTIPQDLDLSAEDVLKVYMSVSITGNGIGLAPISNAGEPDAPSIQLFISRTGDE